MICKIVEKLCVNGFIFRSSIQISLDTGLKCGVFMVYEALCWYPLIQALPLNRCASFTSTQEPVTSGPNHSNRSS